MTVGAILADKGKNVITASTDASVNDVVGLLTKHKIGAIIVTDGAGAVCGIISERDIVRDIGRHGSDILNGAVSKCMTSKVISASPMDTIDKAMEIMTKGRFRHLPVMEKGALVGLISIGDVVKRKIEQAEREAEDIRNYIAAG